MVLLSSLKFIPFSSIKFAAILNRRKFQSLFYSLRTFARLSDLHKSFLITRTYQSTPEKLKVEFNDSLSADLHYAWLRDSCKCKECVDPKSKQKLFDTTLVKLDIAPRFCHVTSKGELKIVWPEESGDHVSLYDPYWLHKFAVGFEKNLYEIIHDIVPPVEWWTGRSLEENIPEIEYEILMQSRTSLYMSLKNIHKYGILFVRNVPCEPGEIVKVMNRIANVKHTRWGSSFHITTGNVCIRQTKQTIELHTDMAYLEKSPGILATHCLESNHDNISKDASDLLDKTYLADGINVAESLRRQHPVHFNTLVSVPVKFRLFTQNMDYRNYQPILRLNRSRNVAAVHFNNRLMTPLEGPSKSILDFYAAYKLFVETMRKPENLYSFSFKPGDLLILNNRRVLHGGHTLHFTNMEKHLESCFADLDEVLAQYRSFLMKKREE